MKRLSILGCRGIPGNHGGFETFAERLAFYLADKGWEVTVYCEDYVGKKIAEDYWNDIRLIKIPVAEASSVGTILFDWKSTLHAAQEGDLILTLGYNTAIFSIWYRIKGLTNIINMDGLEWKRQKWNALEKFWLYLNERAGCIVGNHLIADHPEITKHLETRVASNKITMIPYGAKRVSKANADCLTEFNLTPKDYCIVIARPEPENNILEIVTAFSRSKRDTKLVILGNYKPDSNSYHRQVLKAASDEVVFPGGIYEHEKVEALRYYASLYIHGHTVGGTNPSLVEALGAGSPILAHDNQFNKWVAGAGAVYFRDESDCSYAFDLLLENADELNRLMINSIKNFEESFTAEMECSAYEQVLEQALEGSLGKQTAQRVNTWNQRKLEEPTYSSFIKENADSIEKPANTPMT
ncbi:MAG: DUF1972 domain-containing protein [Cyanobacteria bacterium P01_D01_bin.156]